MDENFAFQGRLNTPEFVPRHRIIIGDARDMEAVSDQSVALVFADPPYNMSGRRGLKWAFSRHITVEESWDTFSDDDYARFTEEWLLECRRVLQPGGTIFLCGTYHNIYTLGYALKRLGFRIINSIVWAKPNAQPNITRRMFTESCEYLIWACVSQTGWTYNYQEMKRQNGGKQMRNFWRDFPDEPTDFWEIPYPSKNERWAGYHPTQKPMAVVTRCIAAASKAGDLVLDPFLGSGTTAVVAAGLGRNFIGYELNQEYVPIVQRRLEALPEMFRVEVAVERSSGEASTEEPPALLLTQYSR